MWRGREGNQRVKVSIVDRFERIDLIGTAIAGDASVAVGDGMDRGEPAVEPRDDRQGVVVFALTGVIAVP